MKPRTTHEEFCLKNAAHVAAARGRTPATRTREQFATLPEAQAFGAAIGGGRTMIYAVTRVLRARFMFLQDANDRLFR